MDNPTVSDYFTPLAVAPASPHACEKRRAVLECLCLHRADFEGGDVHEEEDEGEGGGRIAACAQLETAATRLGEPLGHGEAEAYGAVVAPPVPVQASNSSSTSLCSRVPSTNVGCFTVCIAWQAFSA